MIDMSQYGNNRRPFDRFWAGFSAGSSTEVVLSDGNLIAFAEMLGRSVTLAEYLQPDYPRRLIDSSFEPGSYQNKVADAILGSRMTGMQDAKTLASLTQWLQRRQVSWQAAAARVPCRPKPIPGRRPPKPRRPTPKTLSGPPRTGVPSTKPTVTTSLPR